MSDIVQTPVKKKKLTAVQQRELDKLGKGQTSAVMNPGAKLNAAAGPSCCIFIGGKDPGAAVSNPAAIQKGAAGK